MRKSKTADAVYHRIRRSRLQMLGLCVKCTKPRGERKGALCDECRRKDSERNAKNRQERFELNKCIRCGAEMSGRDLCHSSCRPCRVRHAAYMAAKRTQEAQP